MAEPNTTTSKKRPRVRPTVSQQKELIAESRGACAWCQQAAPRVQFHHIDGNRTRTVMDNLISLCGRCHDGAGLGNPSEADLGLRKRELAWSRRAAAYHTPATQGVQISVEQNRGQVAGTINNIRLTAKPQGPIILPGSIGSDPQRYGYVEYLVERLAEFRGVGNSFGQKRTGTVHAGIIRKQIKQARGNLPKDLPIDAWESLVRDLCAKIDSTALGRLQRSRGKGRYHDFATHVQQMLNGRP
jgi:hypothetical protein